MAPKKKGRRGADLPWRREESTTFDYKEDFDKFVIPDMLTSGFTRRSGKHGTMRKGYLCQTKYEATFSG